MEQQQQQQEEEEKELLIQKRIEKRLQHLQSHIRASSIAKEFIHQQRNNYGKRGCNLYVEKCSNVMSNANNNNNTSTNSNNDTNAKEKSALATGEFESWESVKNLSVEELRNYYGKPRPGGVVFDGVNHVAWVSSNMARTLWFWCSVLGFRVSKTLDIPGGQHFFLDGGRGASIAYFYFHNAPKQAPGIATIDMERLVATGEFPTAWGSVNHVAFNVPRNKLREYRRKLKNTGTFVSPIMYHSDVEESGYTLERDENTIFESVYFIGPDGEYLEMTSQVDREFTPDRDIQHKPTTGEKN